MALLSVITTVPWSAPLMEVSVALDQKLSLYKYASRTCGGRSAVGGQCTPRRVDSACKND